MARIRIHINQLDEDPDQVEKQDLDLYQSEKQDPDLYNHKKTKGVWIRNTAWGWNDGTPMGISIREDVVIPSHDVEEGHLEE